MIRQLLKNTKLFHGDEYFKVSFFILCALLKVYFCVKCLLFVGEREKEYSFNQERQTS